ncbi:unnamed protein product [Coregonus sp. 'balchen']|nr:unnamed protein product [Coregonus sp. 'balchen']
MDMLMHGAVTVVPIYHELLHLHHKGAGVCNLDDVETLSATTWPERVFDIVKMQTSGAFKFMVDGHDGNCTLCINTLMNNQVQKLPLSVMDWRTKVTCRRIISSKMYESSSSVLKETTNSASISWKTHKTDPAYRHFLSIYGTHYIRRVHLEGRVHSTTAVRTCKVAMSGLSLHSVRNCLGVEDSGTINGVTISAETMYCKSQSKKLKTGQSFGATFLDRATEVQGGNVEVADILFNPDKKSGYKTWLKSLKKVPAVVSYQLSSLHFLARDNPILKANLRNAIRDYIQKYTVYTSCPSACKMGRRNKDCVCKCSGHRNVVRMNVTVVRATGLWGDYFSKTDGYVKVFYGKQGDSTPVIWNNDFHYWNYRIQALHFEVWDRDNRWNNDLLGKGSITLRRGMNVNQRFKLKHGTLYVSLSVVCGPSLKGAFCDQYAPSPGSQGRLSYVHDWDRETEMR